MIRIASWLTVPTGLVLGLTMGAMGAEAAGRSSCEARIFKGEEQACFVTRSTGDSLLFEKGSVDDGPIFERLAVEEEAEEAEGFTLNGFECGCQL